MLDKQAAVRNWDAKLNNSFLKYNGVELVRSCFNLKGQSVLKFSKQFVNQIETLKSNQYELKKALVNFIIYWQKESSEQEIKIILPELHLERKVSD